MSSKKPRRRAVRFFFWGGKLHKVLRINRPANLVEAWSYEDRASVALMYSDFRKNYGLAFSPPQAAKILNVDRHTVFRLLWNGEINEPHRAYKLDGKFKPYLTFYSESDVIAMHAALLEHHIGAVRNDGKITPNSRLPMLAEVIARMRAEKNEWVQAADGRMVRLYEEMKW